MNRWRNLLSLIAYSNLLWFLGSRRIQLEFKRSRFELWYSWIINNSFDFELSGIQFKHKALNLITIKSLPLKLPKHNSGIYMLDKDACSSVSLSFLLGHPSDRLYQSIQTTQKKSAGEWEIIIVYSSLSLKWNANL